MTSRRFAVSATFLVGAFSILFHLSIFTRIPENADELIYRQLALSLVAGRGYTLRGSALLGALPKPMYDHATFNHPPGFPLLLVPLAATELSRWSVAVSLAASLAAAAAVAMAAWHFLLRENDSPFRRLLFALILCAAFLDPLLSFCSRRVWMDNLLAAGIAWGVVGTLLGSEGRWRWLTVGALALTLAVATKILAALFVPLLAVVVLRGRSGWRGSLLLAGPPLLALALWEGFFHHATGAWFPRWLAIDPGILAAKPFMAGQVAQPWSYFPTKWLLLSPLAVFLVGIFFAVLARLRSADPATRTAWITLCGASAAYLGALILLGIGGFSKEARYLVPLEPLAAMSLAAGFAILWPGKTIPHTRGQLGLLACALGILLGAAHAGFYLFALQHDEPLSFWGLIAALARAG